MALTIKPFRIIYPDLRVVPAVPMDLPSAFDFATDTAFEDGYWVKLDGAGGITQISSGGSEGDPAGTPMVAPIWGASGRMDVRQSRKVDVIMPGAIYMFETTRYKAGASLAVGDALTVEEDASHRGILDEAASTQHVIARVVQVPVTGVNGLIAVTVGAQGLTVA